MYHNIVYVFQDSDLIADAGFVVEVIGSQMISLDEFDIGDSLNIEATFDFPKVPEVEKSDFTMELFGLHATDGRD